DDFVGGGDGDGAVVLVDLDGLGPGRGGCEDDGGKGEGGEVEDVHRSSPFESMESSRSARVCLCLGLAASFWWGSGRVRSGGGVPTRARALALTALTLE